MRTLLAPLETQVFIGNQTARVKGEGIEFADIRGWAPGDRVRSIDQFVGDPAAVAAFWA